MGAGFLFFFFIETGLLLFTCGVGQKYTGHLFFFGMAILLAWILGAIFQVNWLFENFYLTFMAWIMMVFAAVVGEIFKQSQKWFGNRRG